MNPNDVVSQFQIMSQTWFAHLWNYAHSLFLALCVVDMALMAMRSLTRGHGFNDIFDGFIWRLLGLGFWYAVLMNASEWLPSIVQSLMIAGAEAGQVQALSPGEVLMQGLSLALKMTNEMSGWGMMFNPVGLIFGTVAILLVLFSFLAIAAQMALVLVQAYLYLSGGVVLLGLGGWSGSSHISEKYLWTLAGTGLQLLFLFLMISAGGNLAQVWSEAITQTSILDLKIPLSVGASAVLYAVIVVRCSSMAGHLISGGHSMSFSDVMATTYMLNQTANTLEHAAEKLGGMAAGMARGGYTSVMDSASRMSGSSGGARGTGGGGGGAANHGPVPKLNSQPAGGSSQSQRPGATSRKED